MATHIKALVKDFLKNQEQEVNYRARLKNIVESNIDKKLKKHVYLKKVYKNKLIFVSESSSFSYVFNLGKDKLLRAVREQFPEIEGVKITLG